MFFKKLNAPDENFKWFETSQELVMQSDQSISQKRKCGGAAYAALAFGVMTCLSGVAWSNAVLSAELEARGVISPRYEITVKTELIAKVAQLPVREGERFQKGQLLLSFDCEKYLAQLKSTSADLAASSENLRAKRSLLKYKAIGKSEVNIAAAERNRSGAEKEAAEALIHECEFHAPFDGRISKSTIEQYELSNPGEPLLTLISDSQLEVDLVVPSAWLAWLSKGAKFDFVVDETGRTKTAHVTQLGAQVDPVSRTIEIKGLFENVTADLLAGMSGTASFPKITTSSIEN